MTNFYFFRLFTELTGGDGDKKEGGTDEEDPEVNMNIYICLCYLS